MVNHFSNVCAGCTRNSEGERWLILHSIGLALELLSLAPRVYVNCCVQGIGKATGGLWSLQRRLLDILSE